MLLPHLILAGIGYLAFAIVSLSRGGGYAEEREGEGDHPVTKFIFGGGVPLVVTITMTYLFLIVGGDTTVQFNVGSPSRMNVWSTWVGLWPILLFVSSASGVGALICIILCSVRISKRYWISVWVISLHFSILAFCTLAAEAPSA